MAESDLQTVVSLQELIDEVDEDMVPVVFEFFLDDCKGSISKITESIEAGQFEQLRKSAHRAKGCFKSIFAHRAIQLASVLENAGTDNDLAGARSALPEFCAEYSRVIEFVETYLKQGGDSST